MKVKLKKVQKPASRAAEQAKIKSVIEMLRETHTYGVPTRMFYDRGYQQFIDLANIIQNAKKMPAPFATRQTVSVKAHKWFHRMSVEEIHRLLKSRNHDIKSERIWHIITVMFYGVVTLLIVISILKNCLFNS